MLRAVFAGSEKGSNLDLCLRPTGWQVGRAADESAARPRDNMAYYRRFPRFNVLKPPYKRE